MFHWLALTGKIPEKSQIHLYIGSVEKCNELLKGLVNSQLSVGCMSRLQINSAIDWEAPQRPLARPGSAPVLLAQAPWHSDAENGSFWTSWAWIESLQGCSSCLSTISYRAQHICIHFHSHGTVRFISCSSAQVLPGAKWPLPYLCTVLCSIPSSETPYSI